MSATWEQRWPSYEGFAIATPDDTAGAIDAAGVSDGLAIITSGNCVVVDPYDNTLTLTGPFVGTIIPAAVKRVNATGLTMAEVGLLYNQRAAGAPLGAPGKSVPRYNRMLAATPADSGDEAAGVFDGLIVASTGTIRIVTLDDVEVDVVSALGGTWWPLRARRINATGTTAAVGLLYNDPPAA